MATGITKEYVNKIEFVFDDVMFDAFLAYDKMNALCDRLIAVANILELGAGAPMRATSFAALAASIKAFVAARYEQYAREIPAAINNDPYAANEECKKLRAFYGTFTHATQIADAMAIGAALKPYESNARASVYLETIPGISFCPIADYDIKSAYLNGDSAAREFIVTFLEKIYARTTAVYDAYCAPDINIEKMLDVVSSQLGALRALPEFSRCGDMFHLLTSCISQMRGNFATYYKDSLETNNPCTIFESYLCDIIKQQKTARNARIMRQFNQLLTYFRKVADQHMNDADLGDYKSKIAMATNMAQDLLSAK